MSAERFEITLSDDGLIHISGSNGRRASLITPDGIIGYVTHGAIRQQARDMDQLRADLAAAVAERDEWKECAMSNLDERDKLRARLAAIDNAPVVAWLSTDCIGERYLCFSAPDGSDPVVELIARPSKESP